MIIKFERLYRYHFTKDSRPHSEGGLQTSLSRSSGPWLSTYTQNEWPVRECISNIYLSSSYFFISIVNENECKCLNEWICIGSISAYPRTNGKSGKLILKKCSFSIHCIAFLYLDPRQILFPLQ